MIVFSNPIALKNETSIIHSLFENGLELFHVRKPGYSLLEMKQFILQIHPDYREKLALHNHHQLADEFGINRIHFSEKDRGNGCPKVFKNKIISTSTHTIEDFNSLQNTFEYAFLSPVFKSISKENYLPNANLFEALQSRKNFGTKVIALGGIDAKNIAQTLENGFDDVALLGTIWNNANLLNQFKSCQKSPIRTHDSRFDPSGGAGVLADIKTFEQLQVSGFAILTANTIQTENHFYEMQWTDLNFVIRSIEKLFENYKINVVKIGIVPSLEYLNSIVSTIKYISPQTQIVWDTVLKSSTNFDFLSIENNNLLLEVLSKVDLITPNYNEILQLFPDFISAKLWVKKQIPTSVLLKGGHNNAAIGTDYLFLKNEIIELPPSTNKYYEKHGSGCVLSAAIAANLALKQSKEEACKNAKIYIEKYLSSTSTLIGYHYVQ